MFNNIINQYFYYIIILERQQETREIYVIQQNI